MLYFAPCFFFLLQIFTTTTTTTTARTPPYRATDYILLNCGSSTNSTDHSNRSWEGDERSKYAPSTASTSSSALQASSQHSSVNTVPYMTARVFNSRFTYTFPVLMGPKFIRLYFYPNTYSNYNTTQSFFSVSVNNNFTLLNNFSADLNSPSASNPSFMKEYLINVGENQRIDLTFSPNQNSFAFINGIEIVSVPDKLYFKGNGVPIKFIDQLYYLQDNTVLENLYRINVGGTNIEIQDDSGMFRAWYQDDDYIFGDYGFYPHLDVQIHYTRQTPPYSAPEKVYTTSRTMANTSKSLEWHFPVDSGFYYLHRFHFCEIQLEITKSNQRVFTITIDNQTVDAEVDVIFLTGGTKIPIYEDYITWVPDDGRHGKKDLCLSLFPARESHPLYDNALLNGLEIFKLSDPSGSLAAANPEPLPDDGESGGMAIRPVNEKRSRKHLVIIGSVIGVIALIIAAIIISFLSFRSGTTRTSGSGSSLPSNLCKHFLLDEMKSATDNFNDNFVIGKGGFGNVYKGYINNGATAVAIKRLNSSSNQGVHEFLTEINMLSKLRHLHLVSLLGYCHENGEMILVYEYMAHGTLQEHLYNSENSLLPWKQRLQICIGAAKGLHYLHTSSKHTIIHRDVKSTNILLDERWVAKVSDFGLSRVGPTGGLHTHVSTLVKGSFGYLDPEYYRRQQLTVKSDVFSFGVVLFEVLCARPPIILSLPKEEVNLAEWAKHCLKKGTLEQIIIDPSLKDEIAPECLSIYIETALMCLRDRGTERPAMSDVVWSLEFAMQLQEAAKKIDGDVAMDIVGGGFSPLEKPISFPLLWNGGGPNSTDHEEMFSGSSEAASRSKCSGFLSSSASSSSGGARIFFHRGHYKT
ncbi:hypothetical protein ACJIZ3_006390 [Penstemon smallii]|uniref:Protein kinase domain-containing protein n=1 Tax=Penstemon smallii TaxID=265156 RepID=A0ABD3S7I8_9LAMI